MFVDTHCHLYRSYYEDLDDVIDQIKESEIYNEKYMQALRGRLAERRSLKIPQRRWS